jgi:hypothetical protein
MSAEIIKFRRPSPRRRRTKQEPPPRSLEDAVCVAIVMAEAAQAHLDDYLKRPCEYRLRGLRFCHKYTISELRRAIGAYRAGDDGSAA